MKALPLALAVVALATGLVSARAPQAPQSGQVFRGSADAVTVNVTVRRSGSPVTDLSASDFRLFDNGVRQPIDALEAIDSSAVPVDVTVLVDTNDTVADEAAGINHQVGRIASLLRPIDRLRVWHISPWIDEVQPLRTVDTGVTVPYLAPGGRVPVYDALAAALMLPVAPDARHLVVAITNGIDTQSVLGLPTVRAIAEESNATLHVAQIDVVEGHGLYSVWMTSAEETAKFARTYAYRAEPTHLFWQPHYDPAVVEKRFDPLAATAEATGGKLHTLGLFVEHNAFDVFKRAFQEYQDNYLLRYTPSRVSRSGWHTLQVALPYHPDYAIHARRGYSMDTSTVRPVELNVPPAPPTDAPSAILRAYAQGDYALAGDTLARRPNATASTIHALRLDGNLWPATPHREAVLALDLASVALPGPLPGAREAGQWLGDEYRLLRSPLGPDAFEHDWLVAELALVEGLRNAAIARPAVDLALARFPADAQTHLADAIVADQAWSANVTAGLTNGSADVLLKYDEAMSHVEAPDVVAEALLRQAWVFHRVKRDTEALARLGMMHDEDADPDVRFLHQLLAGQILLALGRAGDAVDAERRALALVPGAASAREALLSAVAANGNQSAADLLAGQPPRLRAASRDPWTRFDQGTYRQFPDLIAHLRAAVH